GMKIEFATRETISIIVPRSSLVAVISKSTNSSAPFLSYSIAHSTGSPASRRLTKLTPLTTLPFLTSRQGMIRFAYISLFLSAWRQSYVKSEVPPRRFFRGGTGLHTGGALRRRRK